MKKIIAGLEPRLIMFSGIMRRLLETPVTFGSHEVPSLSRQAINVFYGCDYYRSKEICESPFDLSTFNLPSEDTWKRQHLGNEFGEYSYYDVISTSEERRISFKAAGELLEPILSAHVNFDFETSEAKSVYYFIKMRTHNSYFEAPIEGLRLKENVINRHTVRGVRDERLLKRSFTNTYGTHFIRGFGRSAYFVASVELVESKSIIAFGKSANLKLANAPIEELATTIREQEKINYTRINFHSSNTIAGQETATTLEELINVYNLFLRRTGNVRNMPVQSPIIAEPWTKISQLHYLAETNPTLDEAESELKDLFATESINKQKLAEVLRRGLSEYTPDEKVVVYKWIWSKFRDIATSTRQEKYSEDTMTAFQFFKQIDKQSTDIRTLEANLKEFNLDQILEDIRCSAGSGVILSQYFIPVVKAFFTPKKHIINLKLLAKTTQTRHQDILKCVKRYLDPKMWTTDETKTNFLEVLRTLTENPSLKHEDLTSIQAYLRSELFNSESEKLPTAAKKLAAEILEQSEQIITYDRVHY